MRRTTPSCCLVVAAVVASLAACGIAHADSQLLWNRFESKENVANSDIGPGFEQRSYIYGDWEEAKIEPAFFGNGLYVNHDTNEGWNDDGANFFAVDLWEMGLTPERGTIEFWFRFKYACSAWNHAYFFRTSDGLAGHFAEWPPWENIHFDFIWSGWDYPDRKNFHTFMAEPPETKQMIAASPARSVAPGGHLEFYVDTMQHFAVVWDQGGIDGGPDTFRLYVNGHLEGASTKVIDWTKPFERYLYVGTMPNKDPWDTYYNAVKGVTDNLKIWGYAKTDFSDRFEEGMPAIPGVSRFALVVTSLLLLTALTAVQLRRRRAVR